jgi:PAS domain S-box-containing protein
MYLFSHNIILTKIIKTLNSLKKVNLKTIKNKHIMSTIEPSIILKAINCAENNIIITDIDGNVLWCNDHTLIYTGYKLDEIIGKNANVMKHESTSDKLYEEMWECIKFKKTRWQGKLKNKKKDGTTYVEELTITPILDENGNVQLFIGVQNDITEIERLKEGIKEKIKQVREVVKKQLKKS